MPFYRNKADGNYLLNRWGLTSLFGLIIGILAAVLDLGRVSSRCGNSLRVPIGLDHSCRETAVLRDS